MFRWGMPRKRRVRLDVLSHPSHPACMAKPTISDSKQAFSIVVAIDFGTTSSGYAYSFTRDPGTIYMMRMWEGGDPGVSNQKMPTALLLSPDKSFHSMGYTARDAYHDLEPRDTENWFFFNNFKMKLQENNVITLETELEAANGRMLRALDIFAHALRFFRERALQELSEQSTVDFEPTEVRWVVTVPAIWKQSAKQFMREAAYKAGIASSQFPEQLLIALEPEAASIYCRKLRISQLADISLGGGTGGTTFVDANLPNGRKGSRRSRYAQSRMFLVENSIGEIWSELQTGDRYLVADCGGGTVDLTVHQIEQPQGTLKELHKASGGVWGSLAIDQAFEELLCRIFGASFIAQFKRNRPAAWVDLTIAFESRKRTAAPDRTNSLNISLPFSFVDYYRKVCGHSVETALRKSTVEYVKWSSQGMLRMSAEAMNQLFQPTIEKIVMAIDNLLKKPGVSGIKFIFLVGGFAESPLLQHAVQTAFSSRCRIVVPQGMALAILKGAVLFGLDPTVVRVRRSAFTYGVGVLNRFVNGKHPPEKLLLKDGERWCTDIFDHFVSAEESVALGEAVVRSYTPARATQLRIIIHVYCTPTERAQFISDEGVRKCGTLCLQLQAMSPSTNGTTARREIQTRMHFGDTELQVTALDVQTGKCVKATIDFLSF
uniref:Heat shock protein 12B n=1 Tax=Eptatretus burgeri TaxID=7764 RepID=A0A8C4Q813_EPTBU